MLCYLGTDVSRPVIRMHTSINWRNSIMSPLSDITIVIFVHLKYHVRSFRWCKFKISFSIMLLVRVEQATSVFGIGRVIYIVISDFWAIHHAYTHWFFSRLFVYYLVGIVLEGFDQVGSILLSNLALHRFSWSDILLVEDSVFLLKVILFSAEFNLTFIIKNFEGLISIQNLTRHHIRLRNTLINHIFSCLEIHFTSILWNIL